MRGYLKDEKTSQLLFVAIWIVYTTICLTKNTFSAAIAAIVSEGIFSKSATGVINAAFYLFYGGTQVIGGYLADRISPSILLFIGMFGALFANIAMALTESFTVMLVAWSMCGVLQFGVWPSTLKIIATVLRPDHRQKAALYITFSFGLGSVLSYFVSTFLLEIWRWPSLFWFSAGTVVCILVLWTAVSSRIERKLIPFSEEKPSAKPTAGTGAPVFALMRKSGFLLMLYPFVVCTILGTGAKPWIPTMLMESYGISPGFSGFLAMILTLFNISGMLIIKRIFPKYCKNVISVLTLLFGINLPATVLLLWIGKISMPLILFFLTVSATATYLINQLALVEVPAAYSTYNRTGTIAGIANTFCSLGAMIGNFGSSFIAEHHGWQTVILTWILLGLSALLCIAPAISVWKRFTENIENSSAS